MENNVADRKKELGDVLLHIIIYALIAEEKGEFALTDVFDALNEKLIFRHPHIFGDVKAETPEEVSKLWEQVKLKEKGGNKTVLGGIPQSLPSIIKAYRLAVTRSSSKRCLRALKFVSTQTSSIMPTNIKNRPRRLSTLA